jgi:hypothetical protein
VLSLPIHPDTNPFLVGVMEDGQDGQGTLQTLTQAQAHAVVQDTSPMFVTNSVRAMPLHQEAAVRGCQHGEGRGAVRFVLPLPLHTCTHGHTPFRTTLSLQTLTFDDRILSVTIAARPRFVSKRRTSLPVFVLVFALGSVCVMSAMLSA